MRSRARGWARVRMTRNSRGGSGGGGGGDAVVVGIRSVGSGDEERARRGACVIEEGAGDGEGVGEIEEVVGGGGEFG